jgi:hypothetical protein
LPRKLPVRRSIIGSCVRGRERTPCCKRGRGRPGGVHHSPLWLSRT